MRREALLIGLVLLAAPAPAGARMASAHNPGHASGHSAGRKPVLVEMFTAQGCADCAQADDLVAKLADQAGVIVLTFPVDYWDYLGWKDTFAKPEFGERQRAYMKAMKLRDVYTPQVVIEGRRQLAGVKTDEVQAAIQEALHARADQPDMDFRTKGRVLVGSGKAPAGGASVWAIRFDREPHEVSVTKGENKGRVIRHTHLVRQLDKLGDWRGASRTYRLPKAEGEDLRTVVIVQAARTGQVIAARAQ